ncbi:MAG: ABC transporter permease [Planctomycetota bacterium]
MTAILLNLFGRLLSLSWLTGPIFDKELRVSSRRRRNYVLRSVYLAFLTIVLAMVWAGMRGFRGSGSALYLMSRMADAGKAVIAYTVWFQFCTTQVVAVIMLSTSISDEVYNRTLGLLMTTPISSFQIVMGKLFSKLLQLILLLAISLPLLAIVRVFGGVPWGYVVSSLCMTLTTVIFVGSLSLLFSIFTRKAYVVIVVTFLTLVVIFALLPLGIYAVWDLANSSISEKELMAGLFLPNPYCNMFFNTMAMVEPRAAAMMPTFYWHLHCGTMLAASAVILFLSVLCVRRVALRQAAGQLGVSSRKRRSTKGSAGSSAGRDHADAATRRVTGPAVLWKEMRLPILGRSKRLTSFVIAAGLIVIVGSYYLCAVYDMFDDAETHIVYTIVYLGLGILFTIVLASTCITSEKEARSWPLLLTTTLDDREILFGKFVGTLRRCFPAWVLLIGHIIGFSLAGQIHPVAIMQMTILILWLVIFLSCSGLYFSSRCKRTTTAVIMNFALAVGLWFVVPILLALTTAITRDGGLTESYMDTHPFVHAGVCMDATAGRSSPGNYDWLGSNSGVAGATAWMMVCMSGYVLLGVILACCALRRFRRNIF